jgi:hypothetical protein
MASRHPFDTVTIGSGASPDIVAPGWPPLTAHLEPGEPDGVLVVTADGREWRFRCTPEECRAFMDGEPVELVTLDGTYTGRFNMPDAPARG